MLTHLLPKPDDGASSKCSGFGGNVKKRTSAKRRSRSHSLPRYCISVQY